VSYYFLSTIFTAFPKGHYKITTVIQFERLFIKQRARFKDKIAKIFSVNVNETIYLFVFFKPHTDKNYAAVVFSFEFHEDLTVCLHV